MSESLDLSGFLVTSYVLVTFYLTFANFYSSFLLKINFLEFDFIHFLELVIKISSFFRYDSEVTESAS